MNFSKNVSCLGRTVHNPSWYMVKQVSVCLSFKQIFPRFSKSSLGMMDQTRLVCPVFLCAHCLFVVCVPSCTLFLYTHCSSVPSVPLCSLFLCVCVPLCPCTSFVPSVPLCTLFLYTYCSSVPSFLPCALLCGFCSCVSSIPLCPLFI